MSSETEDAPQEIIVVRKIYNGDGGHHGGAWKIAYADFMTAMMALFLVLWLVNASDDETKAHVASYFNPVKLRDTISGAKGLKKLKPGASKNVKGMKTEESRPGKGGDEGNGDAAMLRDPYEALDELAAQAKGSDGDADTIADGVKLSAVAEGRKGGEAFKDPFDPNFWQDSLATSEDQKELKDAEHEPQEAGEKQVTVASSDNDRNAQDEEQAQAFETIVTQGEVEHMVGGASDEASKPAVDDGDTPDKGVRESVAVASVQTGHEALAPEAEPSDAARQKPEDSKETEAAEAAERAAEQNARELKSDLEDAVADSSGVRPEIEVEKTKEGLLVRLTDNFDFEMFSIASASPSPEMVVFMEKIANVLSARDGKIVVMGHTDGRPFRSGTDNNWRLSAGRAQIAYHMLVRGGVDEKRFDRIEGHADRKLRIPDNPEASQNRRIEILLLEPAA